jgi:hypothetical protein
VLAARGLHTGEPLMRDPVAPYTRGNPGEGSEISMQRRLLAPASARTAPENRETTTVSETTANPLGLVPDFFERYFAFFRPGHQDGIVPSRIKELARLKVASLNGCDT